jgi:hypothetical protein
MLTGRPGRSAAPGISGRGAPGRKPASLLSVPGPGASGPGALPVLPALRELLPRGLARGTVVAVAEFGLLCLALAAAASADGAWCGIAGLPEAGVLAAAGLGLDAGRILLVPDPGPAWPQVTASLLDGCELVLLRPPRPAGRSAGGPLGSPANRPAGRSAGASGGASGGAPGGAPAGDQAGPVPAQARRRLEATLRRGRGVLIVAGDWPGAQYRLRVVTQRWTGLGDGRGRLRACCAEITADGRGEAAMTRTRWLWLPGEDGGVARADPRDFPSDLPPGVPSGHPSGLPPAAQAGFPSGLPPTARAGLPYGGSASPDEAAPALRAAGG